ncbi:MAG: hypothetical protein ACRC20_05380 [Segniliparus sp.]|uniref:hypothetical protein n=1 Tax=Segniliparus sp. TaxID=2804064 RepID=UPI003F353482
MDHSNPPEREYQAAIILGGASFDELGKALSSPAFQDTAAEQSAHFSAVHAYEVSRTFLKRANGIPLV